MRKNKDFSAGPVWDDELNRYLVDITYPDQSRKRKRFDAQSLVTVPHAKLIREIGILPDIQFGDVERAVAK